MYAPEFLSPLICWWPFGWFLSLGRCEERCYEHKLAYIFLSYSFVWIYMLWSRMAGSYGNSIFRFFRNLCQRRQWQLTPVLLPGESQGRQSLVGCHLWGCRIRHDWCDLAAAAAAGTCLFSSVAVQINISANSIRGLGRYSWCFLITHQITLLKLCRFYWLYLLDISKSFPPIWPSCNFTGSNSHYLFPGWSPSLMTCWPIISIGQIHFLRCPPGWSLRITNFMPPLTCVKWSEAAQLCLTLCNPWTIAYQSPPSMEFSRQEYWSGLPFPSPTHLCGPTLITLQNN